MDLKNKTTNNAEESIVNASDKTDYSVLAETMSLEEILEPCRRLSIGNRGAIRAYIEAMIKKKAEDPRSRGDPGQAKEDQLGIGRVGKDRCRWV